MLNLPHAAYGAPFFLNRFDGGAAEVVRGAKYWVRAQGASLGIPPAVQDAGLLMALVLIVFYVTKAMSRISRAVVMVVVAAVVVYGLMMPGGWL
jgi:hypothetical protein